MPRSMTPGELGNLCPRCWQRPGACLCAELPRVEPCTEVIILRHVKEQFRPSNTARMLELVVSNLEILEVGGLGADRGAFEERVAEILRRPGETRLLFPGPSAPARGSEAVSPVRLIVPDGTWRQARRITRRVPGLAALPRWSLPPPEAGRTRLRRPPSAEGMSTIEAVAAALTHLEGEAVGGPLETVYETMIQRMMPHQRRREKEVALEGAQSSLASGPAASKPIGLRVIVPASRS